jgi:hypothetical protein
MKKILILTFTSFVILTFTYLFWVKSVNQTEKKVGEITGEIPAVVIKADNKEFFNLDSLDMDIVAFANKRYENADRSNNDPDYYQGIPPFQFFKRVDCRVVSADKTTEKVVKHYSETVSLHTIVLLKDSKGDLYDFTLTSTLPDKSIVRLQSNGPLTNENPDNVNLPINRRRMRDFPIDFNTGKLVDEKNGQCVYIPYPIVADQAYWMFGNDINTSPLQGLYRNDRIKNAQEHLKAMKSFLEKENQ